MRWVGWHLCLPDNTTVSCRINWSSRKLREEANMWINLNLNVHRFSTFFLCKAGAVLSVPASHRVQNSHFPSAWERTIHHTPCVSLGLLTYTRYLSLFFSSLYFCLFETTSSSSPSCSILSFGTIARELEKVFFQLAHTISLVVGAHAFLTTWTRERVRSRWRNNTEILMSRKRCKLFKTVFCKCQWCSLQRSHPVWSVLAWADAKSKLISM